MCGEPFTVLPLEIFSTVVVKIEFKFRGFDAEMFFTLTSPPLLQTNNQKLSLKYPRDQNCLRLFFHFTKL